MPGEFQPMTEQDRRGLAADVGRAVLIATDGSYPKPLYGFVSEITGINSGEAQNAILGDPRIGIAPDYSLYAAPTEAEEAQSVRIGDNEVGFGVLRELSKRKVDLADEAIADTELMGDLRAYRLDESRLYPDGRPNSPGARPIFWAGI